MVRGGFILAVLAATAAAQARAAGPAGPVAEDRRLVITRFAAEPDVVTPTGLTVDPKGRVLVIESHTHFRPEGYDGPPADRIRLLEDADGDGRAERVSTFYEGSRLTMGLAFHPDGPLYVATRAEVFRLRDADGDGKADGPPEPVVRLETPGNYPHNGLAGFAFDAEGRVYFGLGENLGASYTLVGADGATLTGGGEGGNVYRCRPDGSALERVATGFWNPFHQAFDAFGRLFIVDNDPDSRPPCRLIHVVPGGDYGYRFRYGRKGLHPFTAWNGELPGTLPMAAGTGEAPSGVLAYESDHLPDDYRGALLTTSWGDHRVERFRLRPSGASFRGTAEPVVTGGEDFRPVAIAAAPDGSLFLSDWVDKSYTLHRKGRVWQVRAKDAPERAMPKDDEDALNHPHRPARESAARRLAAGGASGRAVLARVAARGPSPRARAAAIDALATAGGPVDETVVNAGLADPSDDVRALAVRRLPVEPRELERVAARDFSPLVRAEALRRLDRPRAESSLLKALEDPDPFTRQAARVGMARALRPARLRVLLRSTVPAVRLGALLVLRDAGRPDDQAIAAALADPDPAVRFVAIRWVGDEGLERFRGALREGLASGATTRALFEAYLAALERLDGRRRDPRDEQGGEGYVAALVTDPRTPTQVVARALRMLRPDHPALTLDRLDHFANARDPVLRLEAVRTLRDGSLSGRFDVLARVAADASEPAAVRAEAVAGLAPDAEARRDFLVGLAAGADEVLRHEALRALRGVTLTDAEARKAATFGRQDHETASLLALLSGPKAGGPEPSGVTLADWLGRLEGPADPSAGERVFFHPKGPGCYRCHTVDGRGGRAGPDLSVTAASLTRERLVESIVNPSKEVAPQFIPWLVARKDGTVFTGTLLDESATGEQTYADAQGRLITVKTADVEERRPQSTSLMPADLARLMTVGEFRDVVAFLRARRAEEGR
jgi:putative membrane-bound dehydrogenase-like protein